MSLNMRFRLLWLIAGLLAGCGAIAPATEPAQLRHTPGPAVVLSLDHYRSTAFSVDYPQGWQVVTSAAFSPVWVVFISPDETGVIVLALDPNDAEVMPPVSTEDAPLRREAQTITLTDTHSVTAVLVAPEASWGQFWPLYRRVVASLSV